MLSKCPSVTSQQLTNFVCSYNGLSVTTFSELAAAVGLEVDFANEMFREEFRAAGGETVFGLPEQDYIRSRRIDEGIDELTASGVENAPRL